jgi:DNA-binding PadR family transcriptional regulator
VSTFDDCTVPEKILLAASQLEDMGQSQFSAEALVVASWQKYPRTFGLKGFADQYPDNNKVLTSIMGEKGLVRKEWLAKMGQKLYSLTREGRQAVRRLQQGDSPHPAPTAASNSSLSRDQEKMLQGLFAGSAWHKYREKRNDLTFEDASRFWGITGQIYGDVLDSRLDSVRTNLTQIEARLAKGNVVLSDGRSVTAEEIGALLDTHALLENRFARHLNLLRTRGGGAKT